MEPYTVQQYGKQFYVIDEGGVRCFLIVGKDSALLVDTGFGRGDLKAMVETITRLPVTVVQTHSDGDHTGSNHQFDRILMHPAEFDYFMAKGGSHPGLAPVWEGDRITCGEYTFEIVLIPGHTPGSIALLDAKHRLLIGGDSVQAGAVFMFGQGRNMPAYVASMRKLIGMRQAFDTILASHHDLEVPADILEEIVEGAERQMAGKLEGREPDMDMKLPCKLYNYKRVGFLCE
jgi:hydroxyacylglutathione hydrolase